MKLPKIWTRIKDPDCLEPAVCAAGLSSHAYLEYHEYAEVEFVINADATISGRILRRDGKRTVAKRTAEEIRQDGEE